MVLSAKVVYDMHCNALERQVRTFLLMVEEEESVKVRARLEAAGADGIQWVSILDVHGITPVGTQSCHIMHDSTKVRSIS